MKLCSNCNLKPSVKAAGGPCRDCENAYQRGYKKAAAERKDRAAFKRGFEACRTAAISKFEGALFQGWQAAQTMRNLRLP